MLAHPPNSFPQIKEILKWQKFSPDDEIIEAMKNWFREQQEHSSLKDLQKLQDCCNKCITFKGNYIE